MSWLSDLSDTIGSAFTPDTMPAWGALAGLGQAATPHPGTGMGWGNALFGTIGDVSKGGMTGAQVGQEMTARDIGNQMSQLGLQKQQTLQPYQLAYLKSFYGGNPQGGAGGMPGSLSGISGHGSGKDGALTQADMLGLSMLSAAGASGDPGKISDAYKTLYEHNPDLAGAIKGSQEAETPQKMPNGQYQLGAGLFGSLAPQATSAALQGIVGEREPGGIGPGNQQPAETPTPEGAGQMMPPQGDALAAYRQQNGMQAPPIDAQRAGMGLPVGSSSPAQMPPQQGAPPPQGQPMGQPIPPPPSPSQIPPQAQMPPQQGQPNPLEALIAQQQAAKQAPNQQANVARGIDGKPLISSDGKPIIPSLANNPFYKPSPTGQPVLDRSLPLNANDVDVKDKEDELSTARKSIEEGDKTFTSQYSSMQKEDYRIQQLLSIYQDVQSGKGLQAIAPDRLNTLIALDLVSDKSTVHNLAQAQTAGNDHILQIVNQIKDTNNNLGEAPQRTFGSVINAMQENGETFRDQPEALYNILTQARGILKQNMNMVEGWTAAGGKANTLGPNRTTMAPNTFGDQFMTNHDPEDYRKQVAAQTSPFKGMAGTQGFKSPQDVGAAFKGGQITRQQAAQILQQQFGHAP